MTEQEIACLTAPVQHPDGAVRAMALDALPALVREGDERVILFLLRILGDESLMQDTHTHTHACSPFNVNRGTVVYGTVYWYRILALVWGRRD